MVAFASAICHLVQCNIGVVNIALSRKNCIIGACATIYLDPMRMRVIRNWQVLHENETHSQLEHTIQLVSILYENETHSQQVYMRMSCIRKVSVILQMRSIRI